MKFNFSNISDSLLRNIIQIRNRGYDNKRISIYHCKKPVISIGNLSFGGTGKTPLTIALAKELLDNGIKSAIIGRGYKRLDNATNVISTGDKILTDWKSAGDEMFLIATKLNLPVIVHEKKYIAASIAEDFNTDVIIIDDGFQHRQLHRDIDIVILDKRTLDKPYLPPAGMLREPLSSLSRSEIVFVHNGLNYQSAAMYLDRQEIITYMTVIDDPQNVSDENIFEPNKVTLAISGIANPNRFYISLISRNININQHLKYRDHNIYSERDVRKIIELTLKKKTNQIITTEKDAIKLSEFKSIFTQHSISLYTLPIHIELVDNKVTFINLVKKLLNRV